MLICSWNLNNRVGRVPFRPEAAQATAALGADVIVLNEFYPASREGGLRIPAYTGAELPLGVKAWNWVQETAQGLVDQAAVIVGDLNTSVNATGRWARPQLAHLLGHGWRRAEPIDGPSYFGANGVQSEIDHLLFTGKCEVKGARFVRRIGDHLLAGEASALSDHAALLCLVNVDA